MKKLLSLLLALAMMLPLMASAEPVADQLGCDLPINLEATALEAGRQVNSTLKVTGLTGVDFGDAQTNQMVADILDAFTLKIVERADDAELSVQLNGKDVLTLAMGVDENNDLYLGSNVLYSNVVLNPAEIETVITRTVQQLAAAGMISEEDAQGIISQAGSISSAFTMGFNQGLEQVNQMTQMMEALQNLDVSALEQFMETVSAKLTMVENPVVPRTCDPVVAAAQISLNNEEIALGVQAIFQLLLDNPVLKDIVGQLLGVPTEAQIAAAWEQVGPMYAAYGLSEEDFRATITTMDDVLAEAVEQTKTQKLIEGEYIILVCLGEDLMPVYMTVDLPMVETAEAPLEDGTTETVETVTHITLTYTRQTVAEGVQHTCNIAVDNDTMSIGVLAVENGFTATLDEITPEGQIVQMLDLTVATQSGTTENDPVKLTADMNIYEGTADPQLKLSLEGEALINDARNYVAGKLSVIDPNGSNSIVMDLNSDYAVDGVDFNGKVTLGFAVTEEDTMISVGFEAESCTSDPAASVKEAEAIRIAALSEEDFAVWFQNEMNTLYAWLGEAIAALPASVQSLLMGQ